MSNEIKPVAWRYKDYLPVLAKGYAYGYTNDPESPVAHEPLYPQSAIDRLTAERDALMYLAACAYQLAGVHDAPVEWLDALSAAASGESFSCEGLLPYIPDAVCNAESQLAECKADAERLDFIETEFLKIEAVTARSSEDDADVAWVISEHHMGRGWVELCQSHDANLRRAIDSARKGAE